MLSDLQQQLLHSRQLAGDRSSRDAASARYTEAPAACGPGTQLAGQHFRRHRAMRSREFFSHIRSWRFLTLAASIVLLAVVHHSGVVQRSPFHQIIDVVPYLLIILGALWFGFFGGITCAVLSSICYTLHLVIEEGGFSAENLHRVLNILMFIVVGAATGYLAQRRLEAMAKLEKSYAELRRKTSELFQAEENLLRVNRLSVMGELTAGLAHEIGNPLGGIKGAAEILADGIGPGDKKHRFAKLLLQEVARLDSVVSRFLDAVRPRRTEERRADLGETLEAAVSLSKKALQDGGLKLETEIQHDIPPVSADGHQLIQVFLNLLLNAIQATPRGGRISLRAFRAGDAVKCEVKDSGSGVEPCNLPRLFDPFFTTRPDGTGLGLAITHKILEICGGEIHVESEAGDGATFTVTLRANGEESVLQESTHSR
jgi:signal transduction histidine kinase